MSEFSVADVAKAAAEAELAALRVERIVTRLGAMSVEEIASAWNEYHDIPLTGNDTRHDIDAACADPRVADKVSNAKRLACISAIEKRLAEARRLVAEERERPARQMAEREQIDAWVAEHGTPSQQARHKRGMLPRDEVLDAMRDAAFAPLADLPLFARITKAEVFAASRGGHKVKITATDLDTATEEQFALIEKIETLLPGATVTLRTHVGFTDDGDDEDDPCVRRNSILVSLQVGAFNLSREYAAPAS